MIILILCFLFGAFLVLGVVSPLFSREVQQDDKKEDGFLQVKCAFCIALVSLLGVCVSLAAHAQNTAPLTAPAQYVVPTVNQYVLLPMQGKLYVYYTGVFSNPSKATQAQILLPVPNNIHNLNFGEEKKITLLSNELDHDVIVSSPLTQGTNKIRAEFILNAPSGSVEWEPRGNGVIGGVTLIMLPEYRGFLRSVFPSFNIWPVRIVGMPQAFKSSLTTQQSRMFMQMSAKNVEFPKFTVNGIVPINSYVYALVAFFGCVLFACAGFFIFKTKGNLL